MPANHVLLETIELTQTTASVTFDNIPQTGYTGLKIIIGARTGRADNGDYILLSLNGAQGNSARGAWGYGTTTTSSTTNNNILIVPGDGATTSTFSNIELYLPNYTSSTSKLVSVDSSAEDNTTASNGNSIGTILWSTGSASTSSITSIVLSGRFSSFLKYSTFSLYGIAATGTTPVTAPKAQGGNIVANDGTYWYHAFLSSGTFTPTIPLTSDVLVIAGGGGGGGSTGGGGGAGGVCYQASRSLSASSISITVGAGGTAGVAGSNSVFDTITALGGGKGLSEGETTGANGGSGGGAGRGTTSGPSGGSATQGTSGGATGYGFGGGTGYNPSNVGYTMSGGGGGGAGAVGANASSNVGGNGGAGLNTWSSWASATNTGVSGYYAGGGGGSVIGYNSVGTVGTGGAGGGGTGTNSNGNNTAKTPNPGTVNTGSGGSGGGNQETGGAGGSGIVIIRYAMA